MHHRARSPASFTPHNSHPDGSGWKMPRRLTAVAVTVAVAAHPEHATVTVLHVCAERERPQNSNSGNVTASSTAAPNQTPVWAAPTSEHPSSTARGADRRCPPATPDRVVSERVVSLQRSPRLVPQRPLFVTD